MSSKVSGMSSEAFNMSSEVVGMGCETFNISSEAFGEKRAGLIFFVELVVFLMKYRLSKGSKCFARQCKNRGKEVFN